MALITATARPATAALRRALAVEIEAAGAGPLPADRDWPGLLTMVAVEAVLTVTEVPHSLGNEYALADDGRLHLVKEGTRSEINLDWTLRDRALALAARAWEEREASRGRMFGLSHNGVLAYWEGNNPTLSADLSDEIRALAAEGVDG